jgi:hypothetical protein
MANITITSFTGSVTAVPGQNTTFSVVASANFSPATYRYQWNINSNPVSGATSSSYFIDPVSLDTGKTFSVMVSGLSAGVLQQAVLAGPATLTVVSDNTRFAKFARGSESGKERYTRLHNLGYI